MKTLFIDTTTKWQNLAYKDDDNFFESVIETNNNHYEVLNDHFDSFAKLKNINLTDVNNIVVVNGPGSFTGARIGVAFAQAIAFANVAEIYELSTFDFLQSNFPDRIAIVNARRDRVFINDCIEKLDELDRDLKYVGYQDDIFQEMIRCKTIIPSFKFIDIDQMEPTLVEEVTVNYVKEVEAIERWNVQHSVLTIQEGEYFIDSVKMTTTSYTKNLIAKVNGEVVGCLVYAIKDEAEIYDFMVAKKFRHIGIGSNLVAKFLDMCKEERVRQVTLEVRSSNNAAIKIYEKFGFEKVALRKDYYTNPTEDAQLMLKEI